MGIAAGAGQVHGAWWQLHIVPGGTAYFYQSSTRPGGSSLGQFDLSDAVLPMLSDVLRAHDFWGLPRRINPPLQPLHAPAYWVDVRAASRRHRVDLDAPGDPLRSDEMRRFWAVWEAVWAHAPVRPGRDLRQQP